MTIWLIMLGLAAGTFLIRVSFHPDLLATTKCIR